MPRWVLRLLVIALLAAGAVWALRALRLAKPIPVTVVEAARGQVERTVTNTRAGTVKARRRAKMSPEIGGRVVALPFREGDRVEAGDVLLRVQGDDLQARRTLAEREVAAARAERERACLGAERARRETTRMDRLGAEGIVAADLVDQVGSQAATGEAACRAAEAGEERAAAALALAEAELGKTVLRAPFAGVIAELAIELGEWTTPSPPAMPVPAVIDLLDPASLYISAPMDEVDSARIRPGQPARVTVDSHRGMSFHARVVRVAPYVLDVEQQNRTVEIEAELEDAALAAGLLPGTSADVEVILEEKAEALRLPSSTLLEGDRALVVEGEVLAERRLEIGIRNWDFAEVLSGLAAGDRVVSSLDRPEVKAGARVRVAPGSKGGP